MNKKMIAGLVALLAGAGAGQASAATYAATSDAFVYQFLGSLSAPGPYQTAGIGVWNHESTHGTRGLIDFNSIDSALSSLSAGSFTATLNVYVNCTVGAGGFVSACAGSANPVTTDIFAKTGGSWNENAAITWASIGEGTKLGSFTVNTDGAGWLSIDATALVEYWVAQGSTGDGLVLSQEAYPVVRNASNQLAAVLLGDHEGAYGAYIDVQEVPVPAAAWLFGSAVLGLGGVSRRRKAKA
jgi:hypothetical protein